MTDHIPISIPLDLIDDNPYQPRLAYDEARIAAIAGSIAEHGLLQVPIARQAGERYQLAFGHSRLRAYQQLFTSASGHAASWGEMPLIVRELDEETMALHAWTENKDRADLTAYEEARAIETYVKAFGWSHKSAAERLQLDRTTVTNKLSLLRLPQQALALLERGELSERQAMALRPLVELPPTAWAEQFNIWTGQQSVTSLEHLVQLAPSWPADRLRERVIEVLNKLTLDLDKEEFAKREIALPTVRAASCKECPLRLKSTNRCPDATCAGIKRGVILLEKAQAAAEKAKLPAVAVASYRDFDNLGGAPLPALRAEAKRRGCGKLGVAYLERTWFPHQVAEHPNCGIVCAHGEGGRCICKAALAKVDANGTAANEAAQKKADKKQIKQVYKEPAEAALAGALATAPIGMLRLLLRRIEGANSLANLGAAATAEAIAQKLAVALVKDEIKYEYDYGVSLDRAQKKLTALLELGGVTPPWAAQQAAAAQAELERQIARGRQRLAEAREIAELPMADHFLLEAQAALGKIPTDHPGHAALASDIALARVQVADMRAHARAQEAQDAAEDAQRAVERAAAEDARIAALTAPLPAAGVRAHTLASLDGDQLTFAQAVAWIDAFEAGAQPLDEEALGRLADHLAELVGDEAIPDGDYEAATVRVDDLADRLIARAKAAD